ncbi:ParB/RepB/Spo0J family partition protein (plasmid) [Pseudonocardia sp. DSM 110487]|uniref:ParB/RepB/Spo0J family partition protein n=1 Tax=Pseudonocardia sp. DSM 110487 TaxID=2865833 RepID=UPI001C6A2629|nr:ParB/RepB/Spo0J family partition protein [Pseudonocardia sp. DSM 110487]QYN41007.1 ParB/RepB/Spo0J family partition protein [Pseudonocardia sp. DSM 110487]
MTKRDLLGSGRFGGTQGVSARRAAMAAITTVPTDGVAPPTKLPVNRISLNPDNPRSSMGDLTEMAGSLRDHGQKAAVTVMNRDAYVAANPTREAELEPDTTHVAIDGSSRVAAAREAGLEELRVMVDDEQGSTAEEILESALVANIHRRDLSELDEARALGRLLTIHRTQAALAERLHRSQGWVSQRLALLNLTPELQQRIGHEPIDLLRAVGNKPPDQQVQLLEELKRQRAEDETAKAAAKQDRRAAEAGDGQGSDYDVMKDPPDPVEPASGPTAERRAAKRPQGQGSGEEPAPSGTRSNGRSAAPRRPDTDAPTIARQLAGELTDEVFFELVGLLYRLAEDRDPQRFAQVLREATEEAR